MEPIDLLPETMKLSADKATAELRIAGRFTADGLEKLIADLGVLRANTTPEVPRKHDPAGGQPSTYSIHADPDMTLQLLPDHSFRMGFRHQGFGWLVYDIPQARMMVVRDYLIANTPRTDAQQSVMAKNMSGTKSPH
jgi:hypothetical protein